MRHIELGRAPARLRVSLAALISGAALALSGCGSETPDASPTDTSAPEEVAEPKGLEGQFAVASANPHATEAGAAMLAKGGSAVDAAIAVQLVLTLVEPQASGVGGGAFMLHYDSADGELTSYDGRETAPASATPDQFLDENGAPLSFFDAVIGGKSVGVPGVVALLAKAHARHGALPWADVFQPAIELAENGFEVSERLNFMITRIPRLDVDPATKSYLFLENGDPLPVGHVLKNPAYASTLRALAKGGPDEFYEGAIAEKIVAAVSGAPTAAAEMTMEDLGKYEAKIRPDLCALYRQYTVCGMTTPSSGGVTSLQILGMLQSFDMAAFEPSSPEALHLILEASKLAYADRNLYLADPDMVEAPIEAMLNAEYLAARASQISFESAADAVEAGDPAAFVKGDEADGPPRAPGASPEPPSTSHFSVIDSNGDAVSMTSSVEAPFGSHLMAAGFILNNQLTDFSFRPEVDGVPVANAVAPGKRPRSSMSPTIVFDENGDVYALIGSPGGPNIIGYVVKSLIALLDWGLPIQEAVDLPNFSVARGVTTLEAGAFDESARQALTARGHELSERRLTSGLHGLLATPNGLVGAADRRREGTVIVGTAE